ncbi:MAG: hypothetical protein QNJ90_15935 [Planctomycetota bacterium]|nr:hypothetical protein [Planctomycetota bacterium]
MPIISTVIAGAIGTVAMSILMSTIHWAKLANADMIRALGSMATAKYENSFGPGLVIHFTSGILFAFPYAIFLSLVMEPSFLSMSTMGAVLGLFHGIVVSFLLLAVVRGLHPLERFRKAGLQVAVAHIAGHVGYGFVLGAALGSLGVAWDVFPSVG